MSLQQQQQQQQQQNETEELSVQQHANQHVSKFLSLPLEDPTTTQPCVQLVNDGHQLTAQNLTSGRNLSLSTPIKVCDTPESIGMTNTLPENVTVQDIGHVLGSDYPIHVIDVQHQEELEGWTLGDLVEYFHNKNQHQPQQFSHHKRQRKVAQKAKEQQLRPRVLNQISLEFSHTPLHTKILSPQFVRDLDWIDCLPSPRPKVQYYCLTSAAGSFTDFHVDFGGTSVWYHVLNGTKEFCLIPPTIANLKIYEEWICRPDQASIFLPDLIQSTVIRISLSKGQTLIIPTAWIHAVYTPRDSVVVGGNFLHGINIELQLQVHSLETRTKVKEKFRFPFFVPTQFYAGGIYLEKLRQGTVCPDEVQGLSALLEALKVWWTPKFQTYKGNQNEPTIAQAAQYAVKQNRCFSVEDLFQCLQQEIQRVQQHGISPNPNYFRQPKKTKLKLRLPAPDPPTSSAPSSEPSKIRIQLKPDTKFRINLSSSAIQASTAKANSKTKRIREDIEWYDEGSVVDDDNWMPRKKPKKSLSAASKKSIAVRGRRGKPAKSNTARQRLLKRFR